MTKIRYMPDEEVIIHRIVEADRDTFFRHHLTQALAQHNPQQAFFDPPPVPWVNGIAMSVGYFPDTEEVVKAKLQGKMHIGIIVFARIETKEPYKTTIGRESIQVQLVEGNNDPLMVEIADFLREFKQEPTKAEVHAQG